MRNELQVDARCGPPYGETEGSPAEDPWAFWREKKGEFSKLCEFLGCVAKQETDYPPYKKPQSTGSAPTRFGTILPAA